MGACISSKSLPKETVDIDETSKSKSEKPTESINPSTLDISINNTIEDAESHSPPPSIELPKPETSPQLSGPLLRLGSNASQTDEDDITDWTLKMRKSNPIKDCSSNDQQGTDLESNVDVKRTAVPSYLATQQKMETYKRNEFASTWSNEDVTSWIMDIGLANYVSDFREHKIDGAQLVNLGLSDLKRTLLITNTGDLQKLTMEITKLRVVDNSRNTPKHVRNSSRNRETLHVRNSSLNFRKDPFGKSTNDKFPIYIGCIMAETEKQEERQVKPRQLIIKNAAVHPLVLLSVVDHFNRTNIKKRVAGVILGKVRADGVAECTNAFAVPFDEDKKTGGYFVDHLFVREMFGMFKRVNAAETILGWYHSGGELKGNDITIHQSFRQYTTNPLLLVVNVTATSHELPVKAYLSQKTIAIHSVEEIDTFVNLDVILVASPPEEVGVEHVLRDVQDMEHVPTLTEELRQKKTGLAVLKERLTQVKTYLQDVHDEKLPLNQDILYLLQDLFNIMPDINNPRLKASLIKATNDQTLSIYVASIVRTVLSLDGLITNRADNQKRLDDKLKPKTIEKKVKAPEAEKKETEKSEKK